MTLRSPACAILAVEQYGAGPFGTLLPRRPRRRGDQDREPQRRRRRRPRRSGRISSARATAISSRPSTATSGASRSTSSIPRARRRSRRWRSSADAVLDNLRGDLPGKLGLTYEQPEARQPAHRLRAPVGLRPQRLAQGVAGLRLPDAGRGRPHVAHRRAGRPADALRPVDRRPDDRPRRRLRPARRA